MKFFFLENYILQNYSQKHLGLLRGGFRGFGCTNDGQTPCWLRLVPLFSHRWHGGAKLLNSKGGFGRTPRIPPGSATVHFLILYRYWVPELSPLVHGLSQQGIWVLFWTPKPLKRTPQDTPQNILCGISQAYNWISSSPYNSLDIVYWYHALFWWINTCLWLKYEYIVIPLKNLDTQKFYNCQF